MGFLPKGAASCFWHSPGDSFSGFDSYAMPSIANWRLLAVSSIHGFDRFFPSRREATTTISGFRRPQNLTATSASGSVKPIDRRSNCRRSHWAAVYAYAADIVYENIREGELYEKLDRNRVRCFACGHCCPSRRANLASARFATTEAGLCTFLGATPV
jgi:hypothetical protein